MTLPHRRTEWSRAYWDFWEERAAIREAAGESPAEAGRNAEDDVRRYASAGGDAALLAALPPLPVGRAFAARGRGRARADAPRR